MAKALFGHVGFAADPRVTGELVRLRRRLTELEDELSRLRALNARLASAVHVSDEMLALSVPDALADTEPALT